MLRRILEDYEAKLRPTAGGSGKGKVEWQRYADGSASLEGRFKKLGLPDGARVELRIDGRIVASTCVESGRARLQLEAGDAEALPKATTGQLAELLHAGHALLAGVLEPD